MQQELKDAMAASLSAQRLRAKDEELIERANRDCRLSRFQLQESERPRRAQASVTITRDEQPTAPGRPPVFLVLMKHGELFIDSCLMGKQYQMASEGGAGLLGCYASREKAVAAMDEFCNRKRSSF